MGAQLHGGNPSLGMDRPTLAPATQRHQLRRGRVRRALHRDCRRKSTEDRAPVDLPEVARDRLPRYTAIYPTRDTRTGRALPTGFMGRWVRHAVRSSPTREERMKARQFAPGFSSVYAIGMMEQSESHRASGPTDSGGSGNRRTPMRSESCTAATSSPRSDSTTGCPCSSDHRACRGAHGISRRRSCPLAHLDDGGPALFAATRWPICGTPGSTARKHPGLPGPRGRSVHLIQADVIPGGGLAVFGPRDGDIRHTWQDQPTRAWRAWTMLDGPCRRSAATSGHHRSRAAA